MKFIQNLDVKVTNITGITFVSLYNTCKVLVGSMSQDATL